MGSKRQADLTADEVTRGVAGLLAGREAPARTPLGPARGMTGAAGVGQPVPSPLRSVAESLLGRDLGAVRLHTDAAAAESARQVNARAFTVGSDIVLGPGAYAPDTREGQRLLAHELVHTVQQADAPIHSGPLAIQRQEATAGESAPTLPPLSIPGTGLTLIPGALRSSILGSRLPLPASLRLTNAFSVGPGPSFVVDLGPRLLTAHLLQNIDLYTWTRPGTPPGGELDPAAQARISLVNPTIFFDPETRRLRGRAVLSVGTDYPESFRPPTEIDVEITSSELGTFEGRLGYGPLHGDFTLRLHYDTARLERALSPAVAPQGGFAGLWERFRTVLREAIPGGNFESVSDGLASLLRSLRDGSLDVPRFVSRTLGLVAGSLPAGFGVESLPVALTQFANEITHPGFTATGSLRLGPLPLSGFRVTAPTTVPLARPLLGAPAAFPLTYGALGWILAPPGSITEVAVPALGGTYSSFGERSGGAVTAAALPTLSPSAISAGEPLVRQFPVYAYAEGSYVRRISNDLDLGFRVTVQISSAELFGPRPTPAADAGERLRQMVTQYQEATRATGAPAPPVPNIGLTVFGRFSGL